MAEKLEVMISHYKKWKKENPDSWIAHCSNQQNIEDAILFAALCENSQGKRHPHQYRLKKATLEHFGHALLGSTHDISSSSNFDQLLLAIEKSRVPGIGDLTIYDTAVRIGAYLRLYPDKIYLHAGTRIGATKLLGVINSNSIFKKQLPEPLRSSNLTCYELEDLLCIYKKRF